jgi:hypothetical protein
MPGGATSGEPAARVGVRGVRIYDGVEVVTDTMRLFAVEQTAATSDDYYTPRWLFERM